MKLERVTMPEGTFQGLKNILATLPADSFGSTPVSVVIELFKRLGESTVEYDVEVEEG